MLLNKRRAWPRELFDEQFIWEMDCEEFSSEPVFNNQLVELATAQNSWQRVPYKPP